MIYEYPSWMTTYPSMQGYARPPSNDITEWDLTCHNLAQDLIITGPVEALPLIRRISAEAHKNEAGVVSTILSDDELQLTRYEHATDESLDRAPDWMCPRPAGEAYNDNTARLAVSAANPLLLAEQDPARVARAGKSTSMAANKGEPITNFR